MSYIEEHLIKKILDTSVDHVPFDHVFIENIFPNDFYYELVKNLPNISQYTSIKDTGTVGQNYSSERYIINFEQTTKFESVNFTNLYNQLISALISKKLFNTVSNLFIKSIKKRIDNFSEKEKEKFGIKNYNFDLRAALVKDLTKYSLGAHTDSISKYITFLFYLPKDNSTEDIGTCLFKPKKEKEKHNFNSNHYTKDETKELFDEVKTCPFKKNSVLIFPRDHMSFHGVNKVNINKKERDLLLLNYYFKKI